MAGIAVLSVLCEIILPSGQTKKYVKTVIGVAVTLALVQPLLSLSVFGAEKLPSEDVVVQQQYLEYVEKMQAQDLENLQSALQIAGFTDAEVSFDAKNLQFVATLMQSYSPQLYQKAQNAVNSAKAKYKVEFRWNNSE